MLEYILTAQHGRRIAVIVNGAAPHFNSFDLCLCTSYLGASRQSLETQLTLKVNPRPPQLHLLSETADLWHPERSMTVSGADGNTYEEVLELKNGCLCCSVKDSGVLAIQNLMAKKGAFDYILLETS